MGPPAPAEPDASAVCSHEESSPSVPKIWTVGTLSYTAGGLAVLFFWLLGGDFAWSLKERSVLPVVQLFLKKFDASDLLAGLLAGALPQLISMIVGPVVSYCSDRHRGRWGRRIPFLLVPTPFAVLALAGLAYSPFLGTGLHERLGVHSPGLNPSVLIVFGLCWSFFEITAYTSNSVFGALINDVVPRPLLGRFYGMFRALGLAAGMLFNYTLMGHAEEHYRWIFLGIAAVYGIGFTAMCLKVREGNYPPPPLPERPAGGFFTAAQDYFRECFSNPYYLLFYAALSLSWMSFVPINLFGIFHARSVHMSPEAYGKCFALTYFISLVLAYFIGSLADRFHPLRLAMVSLFLYAAATLWGGLFARTPGTLAVALVLFGVLSGVWMTSMASIGQRLLPGSKFAQYASAQGLVTSLGTMLVGPVMGWLLDCTRHQYSLIFYSSFVMSTLALIATFLLYGRLMALGGPARYVAPE